jgi:cell division protein FtsW
MNTTNGKNKKKHIIRDMDKPLLIVTGLLILVGTLSIVSASANESISRYSNSSVYYYFYRHAFMLAVGIIGALVIHRLPTKYYKIIAPVLWVGVASLLVGLFIYGSVHRGALNWIPIAGVKVQPSEFSKPVIIVMISLLFERMNKKFNNNNFNPWIYTTLWIAIGVVIPVIVFFQDDLGTASIIFLISGFMYLAGPLDKKVRNKHILILTLAAVLCISSYGMAKGKIFSTEQVERLTQFYNPCSRYDDSGYQICNCFIAINDGGITGLGIGKSKQKYSYIPEAYTDSIFAIIVEEEGLIMGLFILTLFAILVCRIINISRKASTMRGRYIAFGVAIYFMAHMMFNLGGLLGLLPLTGVPLPLISYGGSFTVSFLAAIALVQRVNIETKNQRIKIDKI